MSLSTLEYTKDWTNAEDFPTVQTDENQVRADQQFLFNEIKAYLNDTLIPGIESAIAIACQDLAVGQLPDGSVTKNKLSAALVEALSRAESGGALDARINTVASEKVGKTGDTMSGNLTIEKQGPQITWKHANTGRDAYVLLGSDDLLYFTNRKDSNNRQGIYIKAETEPLAQAVRLQRVVNGVPYYYDMLHTGNLPDLGIMKLHTGSYVGTGVYGADNPNSLTFDFVPEAVFIIGRPVGDTSHAMYYDLLETEYKNDVGFGNYNYGKRSEDGKTFYWYSTNSTKNQLNSADTIYHYWAFE